MSDCVWPQRQQPIRLPHPWDSPGKNTGCHFLLQCMKLKSESKVAQSCPTLSDPMDYSLPGPPSMGFSRKEYWSGVPLPSLRPSSTNTQKRCPFHYRGLGCKCRKSRNTWSNRQIWPWSTEWSKANANRVLPRECTGHSKQLATTQDSTHGHHQMVNTEVRLITFFAAKDGEALYSQQKQDRELTVAQTMNSLLPNSDWNWRK